MTKRDFDGPQQRLRQLERVLKIIELLAPRRYGMSLEDLTRDISEALGHGYCQRTIRRDLQALELLGVVEPDRSNTAKSGGVRGPRWQWIDRSLRSTVYSRMAEVRSA